jgi:hypothetical protein
MASIVQKLWNIASILEKIYITKFTTNAPEKEKIQNKDEQKTLKKRFTIPKLRSFAKDIQTNHFKQTIIYFLGYVSRMVFLGFLVVNFNLPFFKGQSDV